MEVFEVEKIYTTAEISDYLKISDVTLRRYIKDGKIKSQKVGRRHRITETALKEFLEKQDKPRGSGK